MRRIPWEGYILLLRWLGEMKSHLHVKHNFAKMLSAWGLPFFGHHLSRSEKQWRGLYPAMFGNDILKL